MPERLLLGSAALPGPTGLPAGLQRAHETTSLARAAPARLALREQALRAAFAWPVRVEGFEPRDNQARLARAHAKAAYERRDAIHKVSHPASTRFAASVLESSHVGCREVAGPSKTKMLGRDDDL